MIYGYLILLVDCRVLCDLMIRRYANPNENANEKTISSS
jgi:hypothetical protein